MYACLRPKIYAKNIARRNYSDLHGETLKEFWRLKDVEKNFKKQQIDLMHSRSLLMRYQLTQPLTAKDLEIQRHQLDLHRKEKKTLINSQIIFLNNKKEELQINRNYLSPFLTKLREDSTPEKLEEMCAESDKVKQSAILKIYLFRLKYESSYMKIENLLKKINVQLEVFDLYGFLDTNEFLAEPFETEDLIKSLQEYHLDLDYSTTSEVERMCKN